MRMSGEVPDDNTFLESTTVLRHVKSIQANTSIERRKYRRLQLSGCSVTAINPNTFQMIF